MTINISISSLRRLVRRLGYTWKRCRRSLKAQRDPLAFAACQQQQHTLHQAEQRGEVAVFYADECRFSRQAPVPYAWQVRGQPAVELPAIRGRGGCSVLGFWQAGVGRQPVVAYQRAGSFTADLFALAVDEFSRTLTGPTVLVLDNASIHRAHLVRAYWDTWAERGLSLLFLPAYSPELNRIEVLGIAVSTTGSSPSTTAMRTPCSSEWSTCSTTSAVPIRLLLPDYLKWCFLR